MDGFVLDWDARGQESLNDLDLFRAYDYKHFANRHIWENRHKIHEKGHTWRFIES